MGPTVFIFWIALAFIVGIFANSRGRSGLAWGLLSLIFSPLLTWLILLALGKPGPNADTHKKCQACAEWCANEAKVCKHCGHRFPGTDAPASIASVTPGPPPSTGEFMG